jgi:hypothetical protein
MYGAEAVILNLSRFLNAGPHCSMVGVFSNSSAPNHHLHERAVKEGIESYLIPCKGQVDRTTIANIRELAVRTGADVVHAHGYKADIYVYLALRGSGIPFVSTCHTWYDNTVGFFLRCGRSLCPKKICAGRGCLGRSESETFEGRSSRGENSCGSQWHRPAPI